MILNKKKFTHLWVPILAVLNASVAFSDSNNLSSWLSILKQGHKLMQLGGYWSSQGKQQHINILDLIGDEFTVADPHSSNGLVGFGYFLDGLEKPSYKITYGVNAFYLARTSVRGDVIQENLFTNLSYQYNLTHYPVYAMAKSAIKTSSSHYELTLDAGIGPNFMRVSGFQEYSVDRTIPDTIFSSNTSPAFSASAGVGLKINQVFGQAPLECGYRFFYLGQGQVSKANSQVVNALSTGNVYANAVLCSILI